MAVGLSSWDAEDLVERAPSDAHWMSWGPVDKADGQRCGDLAGVASEGAVGDHDGHISAVDA